MDFMNRQQYESASKTIFMYFFSLDVQKWQFISSLQPMDMYFIHAPCNDSQSCSITFGQFLMAFFDVSESCCWSSSQYQPTFHERWSPGNSSIHLLNTWDPCQLSSLIHRQVIIYSCGIFQLLINSCLPRNAQNYSLYSNYIF